MEDVSFFRQAADRIWELAVEYEKQGLFELAGCLKDLAGEMHQKARERSKND